MRACAVRSDESARRMLPASAPTPEFAGVGAWRYACVKGFWWPSFVTPNEVGRRCTGAAITVAAPAEERWHSPETERPSCRVRRVTVASRPALQSTPQTTPPCACRPGLLEHGSPPIDAIH